MIHRSDIVILMVASSALAIGVFRWHQNTQDVSAITIPASSRAISEPIQGGSNAPKPFFADNVTSNSNVNATLPTQPDALVRVQTIPEPQPVIEIVVSEPALASNNSISLGSHQVRSGDILGRIAQRYNTDVQTLRELNGIEGSLIEIGQEILYPL